MGQATSAANGSYTVNNVPPGNYYVEFDTQVGGSITPAGFGYQPQWSPGVQDSSLAETVQVSSSATTVVNGDLVQYGEIKGKITESETGDPASDADVQAFNPAHSLSLSNPADTAADGTYTLTAVVPGTVRVQIEDTNDQRFYPQYVGSGFTATEGKAVTVSPGEITLNVNQAIVGRGLIKGGANNKATGTPLHFIDISELDAAGNVSAAMTTSAADIGKCSSSGSNNASKS